LILPLASLEGTDKHGAIQLAAGFGEPPSLDKPQNLPRFAELLPIDFRQDLIRGFTEGDAAKWGFFRGLSAEGGLAAFLPYMLASVLRAL